MTDANRFKLFSDEQLQDVLDAKDSKNTKKATDAAMRCFSQFLEETDNISLNELGVDALDDKLSKFYAGARKQNGEKYKKTALTSLRFGVARLIQSVYKIDIRDPRFSHSNDVFKAVVVELKREGLGCVSHHREIPPEDVKKMYSSQALSVDTPQGLLNKTWLDIMFFMCRRGRENLRCMTKSTFAVNVDCTGQKYVYQAIDEMDKNPRQNDTDSADGRMCSLPTSQGRYCPVVSFEKYISKLHPQIDALWQRPRPLVEAEEPVWYCKSPLGLNTLGSMMQSISKQAELSTVYNNHCIRATSITCLDAANFVARHIMKLSGHKPENSIKSYSRNVTENQQKAMSVLLSTSVIDKPPVPDEKDGSDFSNEGDALLFFKHRI